ncbi:pentapeptide repeat-containing protein [Phaeocystidibacter luteus]|uniref:Pentapeptide repeat-containing protein n=1 Tax=Phaeocystidibacter luteus TaxID=911197 RepID=A0A6N6RGJ4_9FLAO|nr:pentapeptide repeat-containing protein [Phaeocystidibacter luteus]KAB2808605.1 pentapeptide repeat-containing protein [Phaeocystidibacter luteus]
MKFIDEEEFEKLTSSDLEKATYEACTFIECDFTDADLSDITFVECDFISCNLSNVKIVDTQFQEVKFSGCKILGLPFHRCKSMLFSVQFQECRLELCGFNGMTLSGTPFVDCQLIETDFSGTDARGCTFAGTSFDRCVFDDTQLDKSDFRKTSGLQLNPEFNSIQGALFNPGGLAGLLTKYGLKVEPED